MQMNIEDLTVQVTKKKIKHMHLYVKAPDGRVVVTAPVGISDDTIMQFVRSKRDWIRQKQEKFMAFPAPVVLRYETGEVLYLWGEPYVLEVRCAQQKPSVLLAGDKVILTVPDNTTAAQREKIVNAWYRSILKGKIEQLLPEWEAATGLYAASWQVKNMKTRWGSCNVKTGKIWLNLQLVKRKPECLAFVILHELAHLQVPNHGAQFAALLDLHMPDWRAIAQALNGTV